MASVPLDLSHRGQLHNRGGMGMVMVMVMGTGLGLPVAAAAPAGTGDEADDC